ncbi:IS30 family transposase [Anaerococcus degeneri]|uniref:IS30 family transposase n=1 Tax=Anaerococcus degeneri TaxID=361500 RepID=A0ABS7Z0A3_9FIRM|nr:IS30 family transposase [Anaerococcus degeneri]MBP2015742.1 IS30 family transposase [Anaerococcus degeneri]MCA2096102.1 IS30 family transposase [Anaerococcus degeneri]
MSYKHLTINERNKIEVLRKEGYSSRRIAKILGFHHSTISRELKRYDNEYEAVYAQKDNIEKLSSKGRKPKVNDNINKCISEKLHKKWSPEQIANTVCKDIVSFKTIYNWIYSGIIDFDISKLRRKGKSRKVKETRGRFNIGKSINKRPKEVKKRNTFGHWELDTVVSSRDKSKGCLATFVERKTRFYIALPMVDRSKKSMIGAIEKLIKSLPLEALKTFTSDRGKEFACYEDVEKQGINFYFADAYSAWQRGSNENSNGLLREYCPKKTDLSKISINELIKNLVELNTRPRKCLEYQTPFNLFMHELSLV